MLILIAESKTMSLCDSQVISPVAPVYDSRAGEIMERLALMSPTDLASLIKISVAMAVRMHGMAVAFGDKNHGSTAIEAYTGVVFKSFDYKTLESAEKDAVEKHVRLLSSLYGWLRPGDTVKPYRLDFTSRVAPGDTTAAAYWRDSVTDALVADICSAGHTEVLNMLPADAARMVDWARVERYARVWRADFVEVVSGHVTRTPSSNRLKVLRGELLRHIIVHNIDSAEAAAMIETSSMMATASTASSVTFTTA